MPVYRPPKKVREAISWLRKEFPSYYPIRISFVDADTIKSDAEYCYAECIPYYCDNTPVRFVIRIAKNMTAYQTIDALLHEYAHAIRYHLPFNDEKVPHDAIYGTIHNTIYSKFFDEHPEKDDNV